MPDDSKFDEALDAVFEEHTSRFGPDLRELLRELFDEGVKEGRARTLIETAKLEQRIDELEPKKLEVYVLKSRYEVDEPRPKEFELGDVLEAVEKLGPIPRKPELTFHHTAVDPSIITGARQGPQFVGRWFDEVTSWSTPKQTFASSPTSSTPGSSNHSAPGSTIPDTSNKSSSGTATASTSSPSASTPTPKSPSRSFGTVSASGWVKKRNSSK